MNNYRRIFHLKNLSKKQEKLKKKKKISKTNKIINSNLNSILLIINEKFKEKKKYSKINKTEKKSKMGG